MSTLTPIPEQINLTSDTSDISIYHFYDASLNPLHKAIEIDKKEKKTKVYPFFYEADKGGIALKKIEWIEFDGWTLLTDIPKDFRRKYGSVVYYDFHTPRAKQVLKYVLLTFKSAQKIVITLHGSTSFSADTITFNWTDLEQIFKGVTAMKKKVLRYIKNHDTAVFHALDTVFPTPTLSTQPNEFHWFVEQFSSLDKLNQHDIDSISKLINNLPASKIIVTQNFIQTQNKINVVLLDNVLKEFEKLRDSKVDNEKNWQKFFVKNAWMFNHLFPFDVILNNNEAYVGGKTLENKDGKVVDFLFNNGFKDNYALIEIKTHKKELLKPSAYRGTDVFAMTDDLSGGISQALDQKQTILTDFGKSERIFDPKCILIIGWKANLSTEQRKCFELIRNNQKNVDIVTFDELEEKLRGLIKVIS